MSDNYRAKMRDVMSEIAGDVGDVIRILEEARGDANRPVSSMTAERIQVLQHAVNIAYQGLTWLAERLD
jgi:hypothetical protein